MNHWKFALLIGLCMLLLVLQSIFTGYDPDFFWHWESGKILLERGFIQTDPFSYTMPSWLWINHSWLTDVFWADVMNHSNYLVLVFIYSSLIILSLLIVMGWRGFKSYPYLFVLALPPLIARGVVRSQVIDWFFLSVVLAIIFRGKHHLRIFIPILVVAWVNFHGGFPVVFIPLGVDLVVESWKKRQICFQGLKLILATFGATLINPYFLGAWLISFHTYSNVAAQRRIIEWMPLFTHLEWSVALLIVITFLLLLRFRKVSNPQNTLVAIIFFLMAFNALKHVPLFILASLGVLVNMMPRLRTYLTTITQANLRLNKALKATTFLILLVFVLDISRMILPKAYPDASFNYAAQHPVKGHYFTSYEWGGYSLYRMPSQKVFIDGRMDVWNRKTAPMGESISAFNDYVDIVTKARWQPYFEKYQISRMIVPVNWITSSSAVSCSLKDSFISFITGVPLKNETKKLISEIVDSGWTIVYADSQAVVIDKGE